MANGIGATSWLWDCGDGSSSTLENPLHTYVNPGNYDVTLTISNDSVHYFTNPPPYQFGAPDSSQINTGKTEPEVQQGCLPLNVLFTNKVSGAVSWQWAFGDW